MNLQPLFPGVPVVPSRTDHLLCSELAEQSAATHCYAPPSNLVLPALTQLRF